MSSLESALSTHGEPTEAKTYGIHHAAYPCWDPIGTLRLYRDTLGFSMPHAIPAWGWGPDDNPDMVHFFFDLGNGDTLAFFYYFGWDRPEPPPKALHQATHPAIEVPDEETLLEIEAKLNQAGYETFKVAHETIESIYHWDPNGMLLEFTRHLRPFDQRDADDAALTMVAFEDAMRDGASEISDVWRAKAAAAGAVGAPAVHIVDVPEWESAIAWARERPNLKVTERGDYQVVTGVDGAPIEFNRKEAGLRPALWYTLPAGGLEGRITQFDRDVLRVEA
jgi:catechol 2,3-dioxygenase-like lactoylglutathione lyase family enzyme